MCPVIPYFSVLHAFPLSRMAAVMINQIDNNRLRCKPVEITCTHVPEDELLTFRDVLKS
jgi:hypothetical protein